MASDIQVKNHSDSERGNPLPPPRGLLFPISSIFYMHHPTDRITHTMPLLHQSWNTGWIIQAKVRCHQHGRLPHLNAREANTPRPNSMSVDCVMGPSNSSRCCRTVLIGLIQTVHPPPPRSSPGIAVLRTNSIIF